MNKIVKISLIALCITMHSNSKAMHGGRDADYVGPVIGGMIAGWAYERFLYRLPLLLGIPTAAGAFMIHSLSSSSYNSNQANVTGFVALATALGLYMCEKSESKREIVMVPQPYPVYEQHHHHHHGHKHHHDD